MQGELICGNVNLNDACVAQAVLAVARNTLSVRSNWHRLEVDRTYYLSTPDGRLPESAGWYFVIDGTGAALYVGTAGNLNARLNSTNRSLDNFAHRKRVQDSTRNFVKRFTTTGLICDLKVGIVIEHEIIQSLGVAPPLSKLDRCNIEKMFGLFRQRLVAAANIIAPGNPTQHMLT